MALALPPCSECGATKWRDPKPGEVPEEWYAPWLVASSWPPVVCDNCGYKVRDSYVPHSATIRATVRRFSNEEGWGVLEAPEYPDGIFVHFSAIQTENRRRSIGAGQKVEAEITSFRGEQDGYRFVATSVRPLA
jgi:cold shock CspA family protein